MPKQPDCKWAQRPDKIMLTLNVPNVAADKADIKVTDANFSFKAEEYELVFDFFGTVDAEKSSWKVGARDVAFVLTRKEAGDYWDKLQKGFLPFVPHPCSYFKINGSRLCTCNMHASRDTSTWAGPKITTLKVDWDKWKDEDELNGADDVSGVQSFLLARAVAYFIPFGRAHACLLWSTRVLVQCASY
jgi:hypothetical protein